MRVWRCNAGLAAGPDSGTGWVLPRLLGVLLVAATPLVCHAVTAAAPAIGGHGIGLDFIGTARTAVSSNAFTSTGGSIVLASVGRGVLADFAAATVSDNKGNGNYSRLGAARAYTRYPSSGTALYASTAAAGGAGHVVSTSKPSPSDEVTVIAAEFRNVDTIVDSQWIEDLTAPNTSASVTTTGPAILAAFWWGDDGNGELNPAVDAGWTVLDHTSSLASNHVQGASAYRVVSGAGTYSINWTPSTLQGAQLWIVAMQLSSSGPTAAANYADLWWGGTTENGWGMTVQQHGNTQFNIFFVYDNTGKPVWYAMPGCTWNASFTTCTGQLAKPRSAPLNNYDPAQFVPGGAVGTIAVTYTSSSTATVNYTIDGISATKSMQRQLFGPVDNTQGLQVGDMWWGGTAQNGWGVSITQQFRTLFAAWFTYDLAGNVTWYTLPGGSWNGNTYSGTLATATSSPWLGVAYNPALFAPTAAGTVSFAFSDANNATMTYTITAGPFAGTMQTKQLVRQPF